LRRWVLLGALLWAGTAAASEDEARALLARMEALLRADASHARYTMKIVRPSWTRTLRFEAWDDRKKRRFFIHVLAPAKERGTTWLKVGRNLWMYLPKLGREIRIPPAMMRASWMGSDFTNDDLVKIDALLEDYTHEVVARKGRIVRIRSVPRSNAPVVWGAIEHEVDAQTAIPAQAYYYDEEGKLVRTLEFSDVREVGGRRIPTRWRVHPVDRPEQFTEMIIEAIEFLPSLPDARFTRARLRRP